MRKTCSSSGLKLKFLRSLSQLSMKVRSCSLPRKAATSAASFMPSIRFSHFWPSTLSALHARIAVGTGEIDATQVPRARARAPLHEGADLMLDLAHPDEVARNLGHVAQAAHAARLAALEAVAELLLRWPAYASAWAQQGAGTSARQTCRYSRSLVRVLIRTSW